MQGPLCRLQKIPEIDVASREYVSKNQLETFESKVSVTDMLPVIIRHVCRNKLHCFRINKISRSEILLMNERKHQFFGFSRSPPLSFWYSATFDENTFKKISGNLFRSWVFTFSVRRKHFWCCNVDRISLA